MANAVGNAGSGAVLQHTIGVDGSLIADGHVHGHYGPISGAIVTVGSFQ